MACRILVPQPGIEPMPSAVEARNLNHWTAREVPEPNSLFQSLKGHKWKLLVPPCLTSSALDLPTFSRLSFYNLFPPLLFLLIDLTSLLSSSHLTPESEVQFFLASGASQKVSLAEMNSIEGGLKPESWISN